MTDTAPDAALRDQIAEAIRDAAHQCGEDCDGEGIHPILATDERAAYVEARPVDLAAAVMPVVAAALTAARASCCEDGDRTYAEMERHLTERAEQAERERDEAFEALAYGAETLQCAEQAEAAVQRVRDLADNAEMTADVIDPTGERIQYAVVAVRDLRAALDRPADPPTETTEPQHTGGNAEDCPICRPLIDQPGGVLYPWHCTAEDRPADPPAKETR